MQEEITDLLTSLEFMVEGETKATSSNSKTVNDVEKLLTADDLNYSICFLRCCTSTAIKKDREQYAPFLEQDVDSFCISEVDPINREADMVQIHGSVQLRSLAIEFFLANFFGVFRHFFFFIFLPIFLLFFFGNFSDFLRNS